ncbi:MAG: hypothetical protein VR72_09860 [Clostridiaceae bacterium BRH_c20a]|nr:MAG: hypothetical protein VR72_09860 [Clostridiaceae bacterium BRH_c20a]
MSTLNTDIGLPRIPSFTAELKETEPPKGKKNRGSNGISFEHSWELFYYLIGKGIKNLPTIIKGIILPLGIVTVFNIALESIPTYSVQGITRSLLFFFVFITSSYNSIIPRTIFWVIIFTIGKALFRRIRSEGFSKVLADYKTFPGNLMGARKSLGILGNYIILVSSGVGFVVANFLTRNNRLDKVLVTYVIAIALINTLSKGNKTMLFTALKLVYKDCTGFIKKAELLTDDKVFILVTGFTLGLLLNSVFGVIKLDLGGYILGSILFVAGLLLILFGKKEVRQNKTESFS